MVMIGQLLWGCPIFSLAIQGIFRIAANSRVIGGECRKKYVLQHRNYTFRKSLQAFVELVVLEISEL
jgi:hypothetical protein